MKLRLADVGGIANPIKSLRSMAEASRLTKVATTAKGLRQAYRQQMLAYARCRRDRNPLIVEGYGKEIGWRIVEFLIG